MIQVPERIARAARRRIDAAASERRRVKAKILRGCPLDAEPVVPRKLARIQRVAGVSRSVAKALARYEEPADVGLTGEKRLRAAALQGSTADFLNLFFLDLARIAANAVCRLALEDGTAYGTGFLVSDRLLLTNNHVVPQPVAAGVLKAEFDYETGADGKERPVTRVGLDPAAFFLTDKRTNLDFTLVAVDRLPTGRWAGEQFGHCPLLATSDKHILGECVNVVEHPDGSPKQLVIRENRLVTRRPTVLHYTADTNPGASGSPVFNDQWEVVALHHYGGPAREVRLPDGTVDHEGVNEGIRISAIVRALQRMRDTLDAERQSLLDGVLEASSGD